MCVYTCVICKDMCGVVCVFLDNSLFKEVDSLTDLGLTESAALADGLVLGFNCL